MQKFFKIGEISKLYGIGVDSLRYYEEMGLIHPVRSESGYRLYSDRDIWRLNVIRDLRELGFGTDSIRHYLDFQNTDTALAMLAQEQQAIAKKMRMLEDLQKNVQGRMENIRIARALPLNTVTMKTFPPRKCFLTQQGYREEYEMDLLIREVQSRWDMPLNIIGNNQIGTLITLENQDPDSMAYRSVFVMDEKGNSTLPGGRYLSVCYQGAYEKSRDWIEKLLEYAREHGLSTGKTLLEILWIDIHTSLDEQEHITELQLSVE